MNSFRPLRFALLSGALLLGAAACGSENSTGGPGGPGASARPPAPVEVAPIERRGITLRRTFSGALEAAAEVRIAPRVSGHLERLEVDIGDVVEKGQTIAWIDDAELQQDLAQAQAQLAVANANVEEAEASATISERAFQRMESLRGQGVASESEMDSARASALAARSRVAVTKAQVTRAEAALETARLRLDEASVVADWETARADTASDGGTLATSPRLVAERMVDEGTLVSANEPILSIVALDPIVAVVYVPERDYARLAVGLEASLETDAYAGETFRGHVARVAPVFSRNTRQVRVELEVENSALRLKPGMFVRAMLVLDHVDDTLVVPYAALARRSDTTGVFVVAPGSDVARWVPVTEGIREGASVEVQPAAGFENALTGTVVTLGQELCDDGSKVSVIPRASGSDA